MARDDSIVGIEASVRAKELRVERRPWTRISTKGSGRVEVCRIGVPQTGAEPGVTYRDVELSVAIESGLPDDGEGGEGGGRRDDAR